MTTEVGGSLDGIRVAVGQVRSVVGDVAANLAIADRWLRRAAARGADLLVLPECFLQGYSLRPVVLAEAVRSDGPTVDALAASAARHRVALVAGYMESVAGGGRPRNAAVVIDRAGAIAGIYRKTHLYERERDVFAPGEDYPVVPIAIREGTVLPVGVAICADIEYPEVARLLALGGAWLLAVPSADMEPYRAQQAANLACRAIENNVYVALANTVDIRSNVTFFGGSGIAAPDGSLVSAGYGRPRLAVATLSDAAVEASGGRGAYLASRRVETYRGLLDPVAR